jgi:hypothetical protein
MEKKSLFNNWQLDRDTDLILIPDYLHIHGEDKDRVALVVAEIDPEGVMGFEEFDLITGFFLHIPKLYEATKQILQILNGLKIIDCGFGNPYYKLRPEEGRQLMKICHDFEGIINQIEGE